jgi:DNA polymerase-1
VNFAICYGVTAKGLQWSLTKEGLEYNEMECGNIISEWLDIYSGVREYMAVKRAEARQYGYVRDMHGRIRYLPNAKSFNPHLRGEAEREAGNHPIQGGAAGIVKRAMVDLWRALRQLWKEGVRVECLLQVHDEMLLECQEKKTEVVGMLTQVIMEDAMELRVPLVCEGKWGNNWGELK